MLVASTGTQRSSTELAPALGVSRCARGAKPVPKCKNARASLFRKVGDSLVCLSESLWRECMHEDTEVAVGRLERGEKSLTRLHVFAHAHM